MITFMKILEGLFALIVVGTFIFFIWAKVRKKKPMEMYNDMMDSIMGIQTPDVNINNPLKGLKKLNIRTIR